MANVKINNVSYLGVDTVKLPLNAGNGYAIFAYSHDEVTGEDNGGNNDGGAVLPANCLYSLGGETAFNGTSDYIDTGVKLFDTAKDFTILLDVDLSQANANNTCVFHCIAEVSPWRGLNLSYVNTSTPLGYFFGGNGSNVGFADERISATGRAKVAIKFVAGVVSDIRYCVSGGSVVVCTLNTAAYVAHDYNLLIGAYQDSYGNKGRFWLGTLYDFKVYGEALTADAITAYLNG